MRNTFYLALGVLMVLTASQIAWVTPDAQPEEQVQKLFLRDLQETVKHIEALQEVIEKKDARKVEQVFKDARLAYKRTEFLLEFFEHSTVKRLINGANLPALDESAPGLEILPPHGFQVVEEEVFSGDFPSNIEKVREEIKWLLTAVKDQEEQLSNRPLYQHEVFMAVREQLVRIFTLGLTGFDSPVLSYSIEENRESLKAVQRALACFSLPTQNEQKLLSEAVQYLADHPDFDTFDRLYFLKQYINPLYESTLRLQKELGIALPDGILATEGAVNYSATNLFAQNFLNSGYYAKFQSETDSQKVELGKLLFFDPVLSANNKRACASCHRPELAFTDGQNKSLAFNFNGKIKRNSPTLLNAGFAERFFYDFKVNSIEDQTEIVLVAPDEFHSSYKEVVDKLNQSDEYIQLFQEAFGSSEEVINRNTIAYALAEYVRSLVALDSEFDQYVRGEKADLDKDIKAGFNLFMGKAGCGTCHFAPVFNGTVPPLYTESETEVLGVTKTDDLKRPELDLDLGRFETLKQGAPFYAGSFKTPTVRNVELTGPYMHNGAFSTLEKVLDFYNEGGGLGIGLDIPHQTLPEDKLNLTPREKKQIIAFMKALTHNPYIGDIPKELPVFKTQNELNQRVIGGEY